MEFTRIPIYYVVEGWSQTGTALNLLLSYFENTRMLQRTISALPADAAVLGGLHGDGRSKRRVCRDERELDDIEQMRGDLPS